MAIDPSQEQLATFLEASQRDERPVFMLNLLRFKPDAGGEPGREAYGRYAAAVAPHLERVGGQIVWAGECGPALIGPDEVEWDAAAIVRYPSRSKFLEMVGDPDYLAIAADRSTGLADSRLIPCDGVG